MVITVSNNFRTKRPVSAGADGAVLQWRKIVEVDVLDSGDEAQRSGEDSELEGDGGLRCCLDAGQHSLLAHAGDNAEVQQMRTNGDGAGGTAAVGDGVGGTGGGADAAAGTGKAKLPWVSAMVPPSNMKVW